MLIAITRKYHRDIREANKLVFIEKYSTKDRIYICDIDTKNHTVIYSVNYPFNYFSSIRQCIAYIKQFYIVKKTQKVRVALAICQYWLPTIYPNARTKYHYEIIGLKSQKNPLGFKK